MRNLYLLAIALLLGVNAKAADVVSYPTLDSAVRAGLTDAQALSAKYESGGSVYQCGAVYVHTPARTDNSRTSVGVPTGPIDGCQLVAVYHTHPKGDARFSATDVKGICSLNVPGYILPMGSDDVRMFNCAKLSKVSYTLADTNSEQFRVLSRGESIK